jgi:hypothetical protein
VNGWPGQIILRVNELAALWVRFTGKRDRLVTRLDEINGRFGKWTAVTASQDPAENGSCASRCAPPN